jgi:hypothetical protein
MITEIAAARCLPPHKPSSNFHGINFQQLLIDMADWKKEGQDLLITTATEEAIRNIPLFPIKDSHKHEHLKCAAKTWWVHFDALA